ARAATVHREWNASGPELQALVRAGLVDRDELDRLVIAKYREGVCAFAGGGRHVVRGVLDHAVDASGLLSLVRRRAETAGVVYLDGHAVVSHAAGRDRVAVRLARGGTTRELLARVMVDARGVASSSACADLVCPTVGGVLAGLAEGDGPDEVDPAVGEILATIDGVDEGRQHVWEAFPGRSGETTVYLFYYGRDAEPASLAQLYARFFERRASYKRGDARLVRPTFGFIPGWSRLTPAPRSAHRRVVLVGDAAARHSPLTFCGFGAMLRSIVPAADAIASLAEDRSGESRAPAVAHDAPIHALTGALAVLMASRGFEGQALNELLDAAFSTLGGMGNQAYASLLQDEMRPAEFARFLWRLAERHPSVWARAMRGMGLGPAARWALTVASSLLASP
ncbi:MAG: lycopene cyclase, partial [Myxococcota bacterium]|nr:lycopene cyclase [Myxococcota bacterium]